MLVMMMFIMIPRVMCAAVTVMTTATLLVKNVTTRIMMSETISINKVIMNYEKDDGDDDDNDDKIDVFEYGKNHSRLMLTISSYQFKK